MLKTLAGSLQNPNLAPDARAFIQGKYDTISNYISIIEDMFASYGEYDRKVEKANRRQLLLGCSGKSTRL